MRCRRPDEPHQGSRPAFAPPLAPSLLAEVRRVVMGHGVLALPTETFYALGVRPWDETAVLRLMALKARADDKPILVLIADRADLAQLVSAVPPAARLLMERFWPGPLTIVMPASPGLPAGLTRGRGTIGVRQPASELIRPVLQAVGPLTGTSANRAGAPPAKTAEEVSRCFGTEVDLILDGGPAPGGPPSTVITTVGGLRVLRPGRIESERLADVLTSAGFSLISS